MHKFLIITTDWLVPFLQQILYISTKFWRKRIVEISFKVSELGSFFTLFLVIEVMFVIM